MVRTPHILFPTGLVSLNGHISQHMVGVSRFMDCREDEQERCITMHSSVISLIYAKKPGTGPTPPASPSPSPSPASASPASSRTFEVKYPMLLNIVDTPGHVDFSTETRAAMRLCDGAVVVVDAVEGPCAQTEVVLEQVILARLRPVLVINKIDRLHNELCLSPSAAFVHLNHILDMTNDAVFRVAANVRAKSAALHDEKSAAGEGERETEASAKDHDFLDRMYTASHQALRLFGPERGNVVFGSGLFGWGFRPIDFAPVAIQKLGCDMTPEELAPYLFSPNYTLDKATRTPVKIAKEKKKKTKAGKKPAKKKEQVPLGVMLILNTVWKALDVCQDVTGGVDSLEAVAQAMGVQLPRATSLRTQQERVRHLFQNWLPLYVPVFEAIGQHIPPPNKAQTGRLTAFCPPSNPLAHPIREASPEGPMVAVAAKLLTPGLDIDSELKDKGRVALVRVLSGTIKEGSLIRVLAPSDGVDRETKTETEAEGDTSCLATVSGVYTLLGKGYIPVKSGQPGSIVGITATGDAAIVKHATIVGQDMYTQYQEKVRSASDTPPPIEALRLLTKPLPPSLMVAITPQSPWHYPVLQDALNRLVATDPAAYSWMSDQGAHILASTGDVHLQRLLDDLKAFYLPSTIKFDVSKPQISIRESVHGKSRIPFRAPDKEIWAKSLAKDNARCGFTALSALSAVRSGPMTPSHPEPTVSVLPGLPSTHAQVEGGDKKPQEDEESSDSESESQTEVDEEVADAEMERKLQNLALLLKSEAQEGQREREREADQGDAAGEALDKDSVDFISYTLSSMRETMQRRKAMRANQSNKPDRGLGGTSMSAGTATGSLSECDTYKGTMLALASGFVPSSRGVDYFDTKHSMLPGVSPLLKATGRPFGSEFTLVLPCEQETETGGAAYDVVRVLVSAVAMPMTRHARAHLAQAPNTDTDRVQAMRECVYAESHADPAYIPIRDAVQSVTVGPSAISNAKASVDVSNALLVLEDTRSDRRSTSDTDTDIVTAVRAALEKAFDGVALSGPLAEEPLANTCFIASVYTQTLAEGISARTLASLPDTLPTLSLSPSLDGYIPPVLVSLSDCAPMMQTLLRGAFLNCSVTISEPCVEGNIQCPQECAGNALSVLSQRRGDVTSEEVVTHTGYHLIAFTLPSAELLGLSSAIRAATSGQGQLSVRPGTYRQLEEDPRHVDFALTDEELEEWGEGGMYSKGRGGQGKAGNSRDQASSTLHSLVADNNYGAYSGANVAGRILDAVRGQKGLSVKAELVVAEKQRTRKRNR
ncbi:hypothetical protein KIPB_003141 [Kipferlia bialata]|uniref:Tr-type G domain-containing protein n=1 Tax=Kipferlia bialata TaxID=797122 RepID=A0A9K3CS04_9EUKA|nr:hypothetical protein KIPB_003141 [Kipferlia bialata]|eukprot:g3141.t1